MTDGNRLNINPSGNPRTVSIGGSSVALHPLRDVDLKVIGDDQSMCNLKIPIIGYALPIPNNTQSIRNARSLPSIIGVDLLEYHKLALYFDIYNQNSFLEHVEKCDRD